jgi:anti-sigma regulatory factor (Ser/Thr protein kinase)
MQFTIENLRQVRQVAARWTAAVGLPADRAIDFVIAVHEIAANAVVHGSAAARLVLRIATGNTVEAVVRDEGRWLPPATESDSGQNGGMGLPLARKVCDAVVIKEDNDGTTVILRMRLPSPLAPRTPPG